MRISEPKKKMIFKDDLYMNSKYGRPIVEYENETHLNTFKMKYTKN